MDANQMKFNFLLKFDSLFEYSAPAYDDRQISQLLTQAQNRIFLDTYYAPSNRVQRGFEADEKRRRDLEQLIKQETWTIDDDQVLDNPTFTASAVEWTLGAGWAYSNGTVVATSTNAGIKQNKALVGLKTFKITVVVPTITGGFVTPKIGTYTGQPISIAGTHVQILEAYANGTADFELTGTNFTGVVDSFSISRSTSSLIPSTNQIGAHPNGKFFDLPSDFLYSIEESAKLIGGTSEVVVKPIRHDSYIANINNPYKKPCSWLVWRMDYSRATDAIGTTAATPKRTELIHDGTGIAEYRMRYLRIPPEIVVNEFDPTQQRHCVLDIVMHESIVTEAVRIAQAAVKPQEYNIGTAEADSSRK